jgi:hypothetical protein
MNARTPVDMRRIFVGEKECFHASDFIPDYAIESGKHRNLVHQCGEGTQDRRRGKNLELKNSVKEMMKEK